MKYNSCNANAVWRPSFNQLNYSSDFERLEPSRVCRTPVGLRPTRPVARFPGFVERGFDLGERGGADEPEEVAMIEPIDLRQRCELDGLPHAPEIPPADHLGLEKTEDDLSVGVIMAVIDATDRRRDSGLPLRPLPFSGPPLQRHPPTIRRSRLQPEDRHGAGPMNWPWGKICPMIRKMDEQALGSRFGTSLGAKKCRRWRSRQCESITQSTQIPYSSVNN